MAYSYKPYEETEKSKEYERRLAEQEAQRPQNWTGGSYGESVKQALDKVLNRDKFTYDINGDMLYKQYKDQYQLLGQQAMMDTVGQVSSLTGGYGNSYAQTAGQQAYQGYLQKLNDIVPQLYGMAYDRYNAEGQDLKDQYAMLAQQDEQEYGRYRDALSDFNTERNYLSDMYNNERNFGYNQYADDRNFDFNSYVDDRNFAYGKERDAVADAQWQAQFDEALREYNENMALQRAKLAGSGRTTQQTEKKEEEKENSFWKDTAQSIIDKVKEAPANLLYNALTSENEANSAPIEPAKYDTGHYGMMNGNRLPFNGSTYDDAVQYLNWYGDSSKSSGLMSESEWKSRKAKAKNNAVNSPELSFSSYKDYLNSYVKYATE